MVGKNEKESALENVAFDMVDLFFCKRHFFFKEFFESQSEEPLKPRSFLEVWIPKPHGESSSNEVAKYRSFVFENKLKQRFFFTGRGAN